LSLAQDLVQGAASLGPEEGDLVCHRFPATEFATLVSDGRMKDVASLSAYALLQMKGIV